MMAVRFYHRLGEMMSAAINKLYGMGQAYWAPKERLKGSVAQAKYHLRNKQYDKALEVINYVLDEAPDYPEALYVKAKILSDGFKNDIAAKKYLERIVKVVPDEDECYHRWARFDIDRLTNKTTEDQ
jgi:tetratricopeptide (TPR) repeat protein